MNNSAWKDTILPLSTPIIGLDGQEMNEILIPNNMNIIISIYAANHNPEIWGPDSYDRKPERWLNPLPETVADAHIPSVYSHLYILIAFCNALGTNYSSASMTFLSGPRACMWVISTRNIINAINQSHIFSGFKFNELEMSQPCQPNSFLSWFWILSPYRSCPLPVDWIFPVLSLWEGSYLGYGWLSYSHCAKRRVVAPPASSLCREVITL